MQIINRIKLSGVIAVVLIMAFVLDSSIVFEYGNVEADGVKMSGPATAGDATYTPANEEGFTTQVPGQWASGEVIPFNSIDSSDSSTPLIFDAVVSAENNEIASSGDSEEEESLEYKEEDVCFDRLYDEVSVEDLDFSSCELLIGTNDPWIFTRDTEIVSEYRGLYLVRFADTYKTMSAYTYYYNKAEIVEVNAILKGADENATPNDGVNDRDVFSCLEDTYLENYSGCIALIDTGAEGENIRKKLSVLNTENDDNGHGTKMAKAIEEVDPEASILSIKALNSLAIGKVSDIYAAIELAINANVSVINLSMASIQTADSDILNDAINDAISRGIKVVASAGNNGKDSSYFTPGNINGVLTIGACDEYGKRVSSSNYGSAVDYYVVADSTSMAAAKFSAYLNKYEENVLDLSDVYSRDEVEGIAESETKDSIGEEIITGSESDAYYENPTDEPVIPRDALENVPSLDELGIKTNTAKSIANDILLAGADTLTATVYFYQDSASGKSFRAHITSVSGLNDYTQGDWEIKCVSGHSCPDPGPGSHSISNMSLTYQYTDAAGWWWYYGEKQPDNPRYANVQTMGVWLALWKPTNPPPVKEYYLPAFIKSNINNPGDVNDIYFTAYSAVTGMLLGWMKTGDKIPDSLIQPIVHDAPAGYSGIIYGTPDLAKDFWQKPYEERERIFTRSFSGNLDEGIVFPNEKEIIIFEQGKWGEFSTIQPRMISLDRMDGVHYISCGNGARYHTIYSIRQGEWLAGNLSRVTEENSDKTCSDSGLLENGHYYYAAIQKRDKDENFVISGAEFQLREGSTSGKTVASSKTGADGIAVFKFISDSRDLYAVETKAPTNTGYEKVAGNVGKNIHISTVYNSESEARTNIAGTVKNADASHIRIKKVDARTGKTVSGLKFHIYKDSAGTKEFGSSEYSIQEEKITENGVENVILNYQLNVESGTKVYIKEDKASATSKGFDSSIVPYVNGSAFDLYNNLYGVTTSVTSPTLIEVVDSPELSLYLTKSSSDTSYTNNNPNYSLKGAEYKVFKTSALASEAIDTGDFSKALATFTTDDKGVSNTINVSRFMDRDSKKFIKGTTFYIAESRAPKNYKLDKKVYSASVSTSNTKTNPGKVVVADVPLGESLKIHLSKLHVNSDDSSVKLEGAKFKLSYYPEDISKNFTYKDLVKKTPAITRTYVTEVDLDGNITIDIDEVFPLGYITLEETNAPDGFNMQNAKTIINGKTVSSQMVFILNGTNNKTSFDEVEVINDQARADINWIKCVDKTDVPADGAVFEIKNLETEEKVLVTTDENGFFSTSSDYRSHGIDGGVWFTKGKQGTIEEIPDDTKGALPVGAYLITEIDGNGQQLEEPMQMEITENGATYTVYDNGREDGLEIISDMDIAGLGTTAFVETSDGELKTLPAAADQTIHDICEYKNLRYDTEYTIVGTLMQICEDGSVTPFMKLDENGEEQPAVGMAHFTTADTYTYSRYDACGEEIVEFKDLDFSDKEGISYVVYERLYLGNISLEDIENENYDKNYPESNNQTEFPILHEDSGDLNQTVIVPSGYTYAESEDGTKTVSMVESKHFVINDTVRYQGLTPGREYEMVGQLYVRPDDEKEAYGDDDLEGLRAKDKNGDDIVSRVTFVPEESDGEVIVSFEYDMDCETEKRTFVVFEDCYDIKDNNIRVFHHADINDKSQSFYEPIISTQAEGTESGSELCFKDGRFFDKVYYENLEPYSTYIISGLAMDKETGNELLLNNNKVAASAEFTTGEATNENGSVDGYFELEFSISEDQIEELEGKTFVIFEALQNSSLTLIAVHNDINDKGQELTVPKLFTALVDKDSKEHTLYPETEVKLVDTCEYSNLIPNSEYQINGILMNKETNLPILDKNGNEITGFTEFKADESGNGTVEVEFSFSVDLLAKESQQIVAFENVIPKGKKSPVAKHEDIEDEAQTVTIIKKVVESEIEKPKDKPKEIIEDKSKEEEMVIAAENISEEPKTSDEMLLKLMEALVLISGSIAAYIFYRRSKINK